MPHRQNLNKPLYWQPMVTPQIGLNKSHRHAYYHTAPSGERLQNLGTKPPLKRWQTRLDLFKQSMSNLFTGKPATSPKVTKSSPLKLQVRHLFHWCNVV